MQGWECPKCGAVMGPAMVVCINCKGQQPVVVPSPSTMPFVPMTGHACGSCGIWVSPGAYHQCFRIQCGSYDPPEWLKYPNIRVMYVT
jgi:hypothetical protein